VVLLLLAERNGNGGNVLEQTQHLVVGRVIGDEKAQIAVAQGSRDTDKTSTSTGDNTDVLPSVLALPPLAMMIVVQGCDGFSQGTNTGRGAILAAMCADVNRLGSFEAALDAILDLGSALTQVRPFFGMVIVA
jgi:hypothetical protein